MILDKALYIVGVLFLMAHHFKDLVRDLIIENKYGTNYKLETLIRHGIYPKEEDIEEEYERLEIKPLKILRIYSPLMLLSIFLPITIPFMKLL
ncbi:uncharacterized protein VNE69_07220 [Vairimorpha necatrix]|uniref:Membrane protein n=1 Tax=Vairimorpha necatrix TaxID=6039 RepID=A0AAX4JDU8_9MICR